MNPLPELKTDLYRVGRRSAARRAELTTAQKKIATWKAVADEFGTAPEHVRHAAKFTAAVELIAANCGPDAKAVLLEEHPRLPAKVVVEIANTHAERQRYALAQVRTGRDPFAKPPPGIDPPFDTHGYTEVLGRKARTAGMLDAVADRLLLTPRANWPNEDVLARLEADLKRIVTACCSDATAVREAGGRASERMPRTLWNERDTPASFEAKAALWQVASVRGVAEKNARELPRVLRETPPTVNEGRAVLDRNRFLAESAKRFLGIIRAGEHDVRTGPSGVFGTYVTFFRLPKAATRLRIGNLGTFDFPAGCYGYLGSAFGGGGVRARTNRHLTTETPKGWNVDWLKPRCTPAAVWWTHERRHVEFDWADLLVDLPGATCPVARFGGNDNPSADAHLVRFDAVPSIAAFRRRVARAMPGHAPIHEVVVNNWCGRGWPE